MDRGGNIPHGGNVDESRSKEQYNGSGGTMVSDRDCADALLRRAWMETHSHGWHLGGEWSLSPVGQVMKQL